MFNLFKLNYIRQTIISTTIKNKALPILPLILAPTYAVYSATAYADAQNRYQFSIPAGSLQMQLNTLAQQANILFVGNAKLVEGMSGNKLEGSYTLSDAFNILLANRDLYVTQSDNGSYSLQSTMGTDTVVVTATMNNSTVTEESRSYTIKEMSTASKLNLTPRETPQSVSVVTKQQMNDQNMTSLEEALAQTTGVNVVYEGKHQVRFQSRGFTMDNYKEDGVSNSAQNSVADMGSAEASSEATDLAVYDHIEVLRGASGLTQGSGEPGGTINLVRKRPTYEKQGYIKVGAGSWDDYRSELDVSGALFDSEHVRGRFVAAYEDKDSFVDYMGSKRGLLYGTVAFDFTPATTLLLGYNWQRTNTVPDWYGLPMSRDYQSLNLSRHTYLGASWNKMIFEKHNAFAEFTHLFDNDWALKSSLNFTRSTSDSDAIGIMGPYDADYNPIGVDSSGTAELRNYMRKDNSAKQWGIDINLSRQFELFERTHEFVIGGDYLKENYDNLAKVVKKRDSVNIYTWDPESIEKPDWSNLMQNSRYRYNLYQRGLYTTARFTLVDTLKWIVGTRYSSFAQDFYSDNKITNKKRHSGYKEDGKLIPYTGLVWDFMPNYSWYASYSEIYKPQNAQDKSNKQLSAVTGTNYETGVKGDFFDGNLNISLALFRIIQENRAITIENATCKAEGRTCYAADGKVQSQGYELEVAGNLTERWKLFSGYTFNKSKYLESENTTTRKKGSSYNMYTPAHLFKLYTTYEMPGILEGLTVGGGFTIQSDTNTIYDIKQGGYTLLNANANYQYSKNLSFNLALHNITDKVYYLELNNRHRSGNNFYGTPRSFSLTTTYNF